MTKASSNPSQHLPVTITADMSNLSDRNLRVAELLMQAAKLVDSIYLNQSQQSGLKAGESFDTDRPKNFYPEGVSTENIEAHLETHPTDREQLLSPFTVVTHDMFGQLQATPYSQFYETEMRKISELLSDAAELCDKGEFKEFLQLRAEAFLTNQYRESDIAWINANNGPFEFTVGPYEDYADSLLGVKRTFESILGVILSKETKMAAAFQEYVSKFDSFLGARYGYGTTTSLTPMVVMDAFYASGEATYGYVPMAYNLPNDRDIHVEVGSKKVFLRNIMDAKFEYISKAIASQVLKVENVARFDFETYLRFVIGHESAHGLSFHFNGSAFGPVGSGLEEGKADLFGMWFLYYLADQGVLDTEVAESAVILNLTDSLRQIRFGAKEAHAVGSLIQVNWFIEARALVVSESGFDFDSSQFRAVIESLGDEFYKLAHSEDQSEAEAFVLKWGSEIPASISALFPRFAEIPVDIDPEFTF